jgi:GNAT superfamily N-acetyltransferase
LLNAKYAIPTEPDISTVLIKGKLSFEKNDMEYRTRKVQEGDPGWEYIEEQFPMYTKWRKDPEDRGNYQAFLAFDGDRVLGGTVVDIGANGLGPIGDQVIGYLEDLWVEKGARRKGIATALMQKVTAECWKHDAQYLLSQVDYKNAAGIAFYGAFGFVLVSEEDPQARDPERVYRIILANPDKPRRDGLPER